MRRLLLFGLLLAFSPPTLAEISADAPILRFRLGMNQIKFTVGNNFTDQPLGAVVTFNPTVLWSLPSFRARMGIHYVGDFMSKYGFSPISGIGFASYFYPFGLSTVYEIAQDETLIQKSKPGPYVFGMLTPVNLNINVAKGDSPTGSAISFAAYMIETGLGGGYDYPISTNMVLALELQYRFASAQERSSNQTVSYHGLGVAFTFATSYH